VEEKRLLIIYQGRLVWLVGRREMFNLSLVI